MPSSLRVLTSDIGTFYVKMYVETIGSGWSGALQQDHSDLSIILCGFIIISDCEVTYLCVLSDKVSIVLGY